MSLNTKAKSEIYRELYFHLEGDWWQESNKKKCRKVLRVNGLDKKYRSL